eukprot:877043-Pyramimonas_sp.AAC.1
MCPVSTIMRACTSRGHLWRCGVPPREVHSGVPARSGCGGPGASVGPTKGTCMWERQHDRK